MQAPQLHGRSRRASRQPLELSSKHAALCHSTSHSSFPPKKTLSRGLAFGKAPHQGLLWCPRAPQAGRHSRRCSSQGCSGTPWQGEIPVDTAPRDALVSSGSLRLPRQGEAQASTAPLLACLPPPSQQPAEFLSADTGCCSSECAGPSSPSPAPGREEWPGCIRPGE